MSILPNVQNIIIKKSVVFFKKLNNKALLSLTIKYDIHKLKKKFWDY